MPIVLEILGAILFVIVVGLGIRKGIELWNQRKAKQDHEQV